MTCTTSSVVLPHTRYKHTGLYFRARVDARDVPVPASFAGRSTGIPMPRPVAYPALARDGVHATRPCAGLPHRRLARLTCGPQQRRRALAGLHPDRQDAAARRRARRGGPRAGAGRDAAPEPRPLHT